MSAMNGAAGLPATSAASAASGTAGDLPATPEGLPAPRSRTAPRPVSRSHREALAGALRTMSYEVLPFAGTYDAVRAHVPTDVRLTVTTTEAKGLGPTVELACRLAADGYDVAPHLAARLVRDGAHLDDVVARLADADVRGAFVIGGDAPTAAGPYRDALGLLEALDARGHHFRRIGIGGYPEGHGSIPARIVEQALRDKASHAQYVVTQLCFRPATTAAWARRIDADGVRLPVLVGVPGAVSRQKLVRVAGNLGLGPSARYLLKQSGLLWRFFLPGGYSPDRLVDGLADQVGAPGGNLAGFHVFTFNEIAATETWRQAWLARLA